MLKKERNEIMKNKLLLLMIMSFTAIILLAGCGTDSSENTEGQVHQKIIHLQ